MSVRRPLGAPADSRLTDAVRSDNVPLDARPTSCAIRPAWMDVHPTSGGLMHSPSLVEVHSYPRATSGRTGSQRGAWFGAALLLFSALAFAVPARAQGTGRITGTVTDSTSGRPIGTVQVSVVGTRLGAASDESGRYSINSVPVGTYSVETRRLGYKPRVVTGVTVTEGGTATADFPLSANALVLQSVVTTGVVDPTSGTRVPFTVGKVDVSQLPVPSTNAVEAIQGKIAGVTIVPSGQPGSGTSIMLRTPTSINKGNTPMMVVDGVIQSDAFGGSSADLESMDIESIEVVKGAAAASLYGSRAANGVIQIRTRRGSELSSGATRFTLRSEVGTNQLGGKIDWARSHYYRTDTVAGALTYVDAAGNAVLRAGRVARPDSARFQDQAYPGPVYDQVDRFFDPGQFYKNSINVGQNSGRTNWFLSLVNSREDGVVLNSGQYEQNDVRLNLDHRPFDQVRLSFSGYHSRSDRHELYGDTFFDLINQAPDVDLRAPDPDGTPYLFQGDPEGREENPLYVLATEDNRRRRARTQGSLAARYEPLGWLSFDGNVSYDRSDRRNNFFLDQGLKTEGFAGGGPGEISVTTGTTNALNAEVSANLLGEFGPATVRTTFRSVMERESNEVTTSDGENLTAPGVRSLNNAQVLQTSSSIEEIRATGYFLSVGADYDGKYIADALYRRDGSSLFGPDEIWNNYYRVSGAYRMSEEAWWPVPALSEFKLRASRGTAGTRPDFSDQYETFSFAAGGNLVKQNLGNRSLKPEKATETEIGIDAILHDRYSLQLSYARVNVVDELIQIPLAGIYGFGNQYQNAGKIKGNTIEGTLEARLISRPNLSWRMGLVADRSRHEVTEFKRACQQTNTIAFHCAGETLGAMYGFHFVNSIDQLPVEAQARANEFAVNDEGLLVYVGYDSVSTPGFREPYKYTQGETKKRWGTAPITIGGGNYAFGMPIIMRDSTGSNAVVRIGDGNPDFHWGLSNNVSWRGIAFYALVDAQVGGQNYNQTRQRMYQWAKHGDVDQNGKTQELKKPIEYYIALYQANDPTDYFVEDAGYVKLREASISYQLSGRLLNAVSRFGARGATLSLIGRNLLTFSDYSGYDPEVGNTIVRLDSFDYPRYRTFSGSFQIVF
jgi:TonB-linked SusC/RagA family outer membrane protein